MTPASARGNVYLFTCCCAFSGWYWCLPTADKEAKTAARMLFFFVMCDLAGYPMILGSDNAKEFVSDVIKELVNLFGSKHVLGSAYHPQAQGAVERPHRDYNVMTRTFMDNVENWDDLAPIFQWSVRTSAKVFSGYTPYEIITGMKPRSPIDAVLSNPSSVEQISTDEYVRELVKYMRTVHDLVQTSHTEVREKRRDAKYRELGPGTFLTKGDYCFVSRPAQKDLGRRFQSKNYDEVYQVHDIHGSGAEAKAYILCDLAGRTYGLEFTNPVAAERLTPVDLLPQTPVSPEGDVKTKLLVQDEKSNDQRSGTIKAQSLDGRVYIEYDDKPGEQVAEDLSKLNYVWV